MLINQVEQQNFNGILSGDANFLKRGAIALGMSRAEATKKINKIAHLFDSSDFDIFLARPRDNFEDRVCRGAIIVANKNSVCKGMYITPESCRDAGLLDKYLAAAERLTKEDYSLATNTPNTLDWVM